MMISTIKHKHKHKHKANMKSNLYFQGVRIHLMNLRPVGDSKILALWLVLGPQFPEPHVGVVIEVHRPHHHLLHAPVVGLHMGDGDGGHHLPGRHGLVVVGRLQHPPTEADLTLVECKP